MTTLNSNYRPAKPKPAPASETERFRLTLAALIGIAVAALVIAGAVLISHDNNASAPAIKAAKWSSFKPDGSGDSAAEEIADYVSSEYAVSLTQLFTVITPVATQQFDQSLGAFTGTGLQAWVSPTGQKKDLQPVPNGVVAYNLCGTGPGNDCSLSMKPTTGLELLGKREALELALYSFKYLKNAKFVAVLLPRGLATGQHASAVTEAVVYTRKELASRLSVPLSETLTADPPAFSALTRYVKTVEAAYVQLYSSHSLYRATVQQEQAGATLLELSKLPTQ